VNGGYQIFIDQSSGTTSMPSISDNVGLNLTSSASNSATSVANVVQTALDANLNVNGINNIISSSNNVTGAIQGLTLNLTGTGTTTVQVSQDFSTAQTAVQNFVNEYNSAINLIGQELSYDSTTGYTGDLFGDPTLMAIQSNLRTMMSGFFDNPTGPYTSLGSVGISTSGANYGQDPSLTFDTSQFTAALTANPQSVANLFGAPYGGVTPSISSSSPQGVANQLDAYLQPMISYGGTLSQTVNSINSQITGLQSQISDFSQQVTNYQNNLVSQYAQLNTLISSWDSQGSWLTQQVNAMTKSSG